MPSILYNPLYLNQNTGFPTGMPANAILQIAGVSGPIFTVGGKELLFADGTTTGGGTSSFISLQTSYDSSSSSGHPAVINLAPGRDFIIDAPGVAGTSFKIDSITGDVTIAANLTVGGTHTVINSTTYESDHIRLFAQSPSVPALYIGPSNGQNNPGTDLVVVSINPGDTVHAALRVDAFGVTTLSTLNVLGLINGINLGTLNTSVQNHIFVNGSYKHLAYEINITPGTFSSVTPRNVQTVLEFLDTSINSIDDQVSGLHDDVDNLQSQINSINQAESGEPTGFTYVAVVPSTEWVVHHNKNSKNFIFLMFDDNGFMFQPDTAQIVDTNTLIVNFGAPTSGRLNMIFYKETLF